MLMAMADYLAEVEHAVKGLLDLVWAEHRRIQDLRAMMPAREVIEREYVESTALIEQSEDYDDMMLGVGRYWENYFEREGMGISASKEIRDIEQVIQVRRMSLDALAGALLQVAKQGISITRPPGKEPPSKGRLVGAQPLAKVVWYARNQALHWEDKSFSEKVTACFTQLASDLDPVFGDFPKRSMALDVVDTLGWRTWSDFRSDLLMV